MPKWQGFLYLPKVSVSKQNVLLSHSQQSVRTFHLHKPRVTTSFSSLALLEQTFLIFLHGMCFQSLFSGLLLSCESFALCPAFPKPGRASRSPAASCTQHPALVLPFFLEQHHTVDSYSVHGSHPELPFCSTAAWPLIPHFLFVLLISSS